LAAARGGWFVHNPRSNEGNHVGYASALSQSREVALGTDGWNPDMAEEERALYRLAAAHDDGAVDGRLAAGHRLVAERFETDPQPLAPGAVGDVVVTENGRVRHVVVAGRPVVTDGRLLSADEDSISAEAHREAAQLWDRMASI
jgi:cytosine/adenosine deaminase-related metal-dependent hydrolase